MKMKKYRFRRFMNWFWRYTKGELYFLGLIVLGALPFVLSCVFSFWWMFLYLVDFPVLLSIMASGDEE